MGVPRIINLESKISEKRASHVSVTEAFVEIHLTSTLKVRKSLNHELLIRYEDPKKVMKFSIDFLGFLTELGRDESIQDLRSQTKSWSNDLIGDEFRVSNRDTFLQILLDVVFNTLRRESTELIVKLEIDIVTTINDYAKPEVAILTLAMDSTTITNTSGTTLTKLTEGGGKICPMCLDYYLEGQNVTTTKCVHKFHLGCILPWISISQRTECPHCQS
ncbi:hypothetical protein GIB67_029418 [Kingdonia uniflora]|uniref:RING-type E3 ubiquitin transferase n=1 Tax=Kingdonia uniflora TaxID=39325 RepID=A0A7J7NY28_9MAGN|nr:hypothetical protein GIB67_029418 [Kingdonia uniflora]